MAVAMGTAFSRLHAAAREAGWTDGGKPGAELKGHVVGTQGRAPKDPASLVPTP